MWNIRGILNSQNNAKKDAILVSKTNSVGHSFLWKNYILLAEKFSEK